MRTQVLVGVSALLLILSSFLLGSDQANFSGKWILNDEKSNLGEGGRAMLATKMTVTQSADKMSLERVSRRRNGEEMTSKEELTLDGKECKNTVRDREVTATAKWSADGKSLTIASKSTFERNGNRMQIDAVEVWQLTDGGKSLTIQYNSKSSRGERKATLVYEKEQAEK